MYLFKLELSSNHILVIYTNVEGRGHGSLKSHALNKDS